MQCLADQTNRYSVQNRVQHWQRTTATEILSFLGVIFAHGNLCTSTHHKVEIVLGQAMLQNLHMVDNTSVSTNDRFYKMRALITHLQHMHVPILL